MANIDINALFAAQDANDNNSRKNFWYLDDTGQYHSARGLNENYAEALGFFPTVGAGGVIATDRVVTRRRTISFTDVSGKVKGQLEVGRPIAPIFVEGGQLTLPRKGKAGGIVVNVVGAQGEKVRFSNPDIAKDSGQLSGDNP